MAQAEDAVRLLLTDSPAEAERLAKKLSELNRMRQKIENEMYEKIAPFAEEQMENPHGALVIAGADWHSGVVGIVASRLSEKYIRPVFMICIENGMGKGSARSFYGVNIMDMMKQTSFLLDSWGGHPFAAGFTIREENISVFRELVSELSVELSPAHVYIDAEVTAEELAPELVDGLDVLEPHGPVNDPPLFLLREVELVEIVPLGWGRSVKLLLRKGGHDFPAFFFGADTEHMELCEGDIGDAVCVLEVVGVKGRRGTQLLISDLSMLEDEQKRLLWETGLYLHFIQGMQISRPGAEILMPSKQDFIALLRHLRRNCNDENRYESKIGPMCRRIMREEHVESGYARFLVCLEALREAGRLNYTFSDGIVSATMGKNEPINLNEAKVLKRIREIISEK